MYCCQAIRERQFRDCKAFQVTSKNREFDKKVLEVCDKKNDALGISVKGTTIFTTDLHAADAVYHTTCDSSFGTGTVKRESCITRLRKTSRFRSWKSFSANDRVFMCKCWRTNYTKWFIRTHGFFSKGFSTRSLYYKMDET